MDIRLTVPAGLPAGAPSASASGGVYHEYCERYGKQIISVSEEGLDMSTNMGRMFAGILVQFAEWELHTISERRTKAMSVMRREARYPGGHCP